LEHPHYKENAARMSRQLQAKDSIATACLRIEELLVG
jgi:hypothetical protein